jgi:hypothetical protein
MVMIQQMAAMMIMSQQQQQPPGALPTRNGVSSSTGAPPSSQAPSMGAFVSFGWGYAVPTYDIRTGQTGLEEYL